MMSSRTALLLLVCVSLAAEAAATKKVLSFGGNGNIGSEVLHQMIEKGGYDITIVSRGSWHFDSAVRVMPYVKLTICDRAKEAPCAHEKTCQINPLVNCTDLMKVINETDHFDYVLDFSGYEAKWIHDAAEVLKGKVGVYIYISTDSVYEVTEAKPEMRPSLETDDVRPDDPKKRKELKNADRYGDAKLASEEALKRLRKEGGFPYVALRLCDVIGPRDTTYRWFLYQMWVKFYHDLKIKVFVPPNIMKRKQSLTYVMDAAQAVFKVIEKGEEVYDQSYNIGMETEVTLWDTVSKIAKIMGVEGVEQDNTDHDRTFHMYPTVFSGPVDISKAKKMLDFKPTDMDVAFKDTIDWYEKAFIEQESERKEMVSRFITYVVPRTMKDQFYIAVETELEKHGIVNEKFRKKRKGDLGDFEHEEL